MLSLRSVVLLALCSLVACDKKEDAPAKKDAPAKSADAEKPGKEDKPAEKAVAFDVTHDKSGAIARAAAVLEAEGVDNEDLRELSHHAEKLPTPAAICAHIFKLQGNEGDKAACVKDSEHHLAQLGPELFREATTCVMEATTSAGLDVCVAAEAAAEEALHEEKHGDGLDKAACDKFFDKFEALAMKDAGDQAEHVKEVLEEVRADVVVGCMEQGAKAEMECAEKAETTHDLKECASHIL